MADISLSKFNDQGTVITEIQSWQCGIVPTDQGKMLVCRVRSSMPMQPKIVIATISTRNYPPETPTAQIFGDAKQMVHDVEQQARSHGAEFYPLDGDGKAVEDDLIILWTPLL